MFLKNKGFHPSDRLKRCYTIAFGPLNTIIHIVIDFVTGNVSAQFSILRTIFLCNRIIKNKITI